MEARAASVLSFLVAFLDCFSSTAFLQLLFFECFSSTASRPKANAGEANADDE
jgi:hypothetical protein